MTGPSVAKVRERYARDATSYGESVLTATAKLRRDLDAVDAAVEAGLRVPSSASGETFVESSARDVYRAIAARQNAYDAVALLEGLES